MLMLMLESYFEYSMLEAQRTGRLVMAPNEGDAAAVWLLPRSSDEQAFVSAAKTSLLSRLLGPRGSKNYHAIVEYMAPLAERHLPASGWYLSILGVKPACQGQGLGQMLRQSTLKEASSLEQVCYLETFAPRNMRFYQRLGFSQVAQYREQTTGCPYVIMRREASQAPSPTGRVQV
jgi:GNAT superfamily N-acetyltransferase